MYRVNGWPPSACPQMRAGGAEGRSNGPFKMTCLVFLLVFRLSVEVRVGL
jgi:hypothetical protein